MDNECVDITCSTELQRSTCANRNVLDADSVLAFKLLGQHVQKTGIAHGCGRGETERLRGVLVGNDATSEWEHEKKGKRCRKRSHFNQTS